MARAILFFLDKYGFDTAILACLIFLVYKLGFKLFNNHLKHIDAKLDNNTEKLDNMSKEINEQGQRISNVEGFLGK